MSANAVKYGTRCKSHAWKVLTKTRFKKLTMLNYKCVNCGAIRFKSEEYRNIYEQ